MKMKTNKTMNCWRANKLFYGIITNQSFMYTCHVGVAILYFREEKKLIKPVVNHVQPDTPRKKKDNIFVMHVAKGQYILIMENSTVYRAQR